MSKPCIIPDCLLLQQKSQLNMFKVKLGLLVVYLLLLESALISSTTAFRVRKDRNVTKTKVLILGGGLSGITAAKTLLDNNIKDFYVLEGQDYIGGRIHAAQFEGVTIEEGANWLHSLDEELSARFLKWKTHKSMEGIWCNYSDFIIRLVHCFVLVAVIIDASASLN